MTDIYDLEEQVVSSASLAAFISGLAEDLRNNSEDDSWENPTLERFLDALAAYTNAYRGPALDALRKDFDLPSEAFFSEPTWQLFANLLMGAKVYE